jgi:hypothetical protein
MAQAVADATVLIALAKIGLLDLLAARDIALSAEEQSMILACTHEATLQHWIKRAAAASRIDDVLDD